MNKKPKVLVFMLSRSGCIAYATRMLNFLKGIEQYVFVSSLSKEELPKGSHKVWTYRNSFEFILSSFFVLPFLCLWTFLLISRGKYTTAYFPVFHHWNIFLIIVCKLLKVKVVFTVHDGIMHDGEANFIEQHLVNQNILYTDKLIFLSKHVQKITQSKVDFTASAQIIPHPLLNVGLENDIQRYLPQKPSILFLGRVVKYKGVDLLLEVMQDISRNEYEKITIAGLHHASFVAKMENENAIYINKWLEEDEMKHLLQTHDILVLPYLEASQSGVIPLGIMAGIPIVCTKVGGLMEQLTEAEAVFVEPTVESLKKGLYSLMKDEKLYLEIHQNLKGKIQKHDENIESLLRKALFE